MTSDAQKNAGYLLPEQIDDHELLCVQLKIPNNQEYIAAFTGQMYDLATWFTWEKSYTPGDRRATNAAQYWLHLLETYLCVDFNNPGLDNGMGCFPSVMWRQNPEDFCQLQQSLDGGTTWTTVFDYSLCSGGQGTELYILMQQAVNEENRYRMEIWDGNPTTIDPDAPTTTYNYGGTSEGNAALCNAVQAYVQNQLLAYYNKLLIGIGAAAATAGILGWVTGGLSLIVGGVVVLAAGLALAAVQSAINDQSAVDNMVCNLTDALEGIVVNEGDFWIALAGVSCTTLNECTIKDILLSGVSKSENYLYFLAVIGEAKREVAAGIDNCPCGDDFCYYFSFATAGEEDWSLVYPGKQEGGTYTVGSGFIGTDYVDTISNPDIATRSVGIRRTLSPRRLTNVKVFFDLTKGNIDQTAQSCFRITINGAVVVNRSFASIANGTNLMIEWTGSIDAVSSIIVSLRASRKSSTPHVFGGSCRVNSVQVSGVGSNPFGTDNCV